MILHGQIHKLEELLLPNQYVWLAASKRKSVGLATMKSFVYIVDRTMSAFATRTKKNIVGKEHLLIG